MHYKIFLCVLLFPVSLSAQNGELSLTLEQSASLMNKGSRTLQMADKAVDIARSERQKMNAFWYPSLNASGAYVHLSNHIEVKEPLRQFTDPAKDFVHSIVPDDKFISSILDNIGAHTLTFPLLERNLTTIDANVMWPLFTGGKRIFKMAPIHHHFELCGWSETRVVAVFSIITAILCLIAYLGL